MKHTNSSNPTGFNALIIASVIVIIMLTLGCQRASSQALTSKMTIIATDYAYSGVPKTIKAGIVQATFVNKGKTVHEACFVKVKQGTSRDSVVKKLPTGVKPLVTAGEAASPGYGNTFTATFTKSRLYVGQDGRASSRDRSSHVEGIQGEVNTCIQ